MALLATALEDVSPEANYLLAERLQCLAVQGHGMVVKPALNHLFEPAALLGDRSVHLCGQLRFDIAKLGPQAFAYTATDHHETPIPCFTTTMRKTEEVERFWFSPATLASILVGEPAEFEQAGLLGVKGCSLCGAMITRLFSCY
jgi:hypothetical protein